MEASPEDGHRAVRVPPGHEGGNRGGTSPLAPVRNKVAIGDRRSGTGVVSGGRVPASSVKRHAGHGDVVESVSGLARCVALN
jgi:hypothetical protein